MIRYQPLLCSSCGAVNWRIAPVTAGNASYCDTCRSVVAHWPLPRAA